MPLFRRYENWGEDVSPSLFRNFVKPYPSGEAWPDAYYKVALELTSGVGGRRNDRMANANARPAQPPDYGRAVSYDHRGLDLNRALGDKATPQRRSIRLDVPELRRPARALAN